MEVIINKKQFVNALKKAVIFVGNGRSGKYILRNVNLNIDTANKKIEMAATDGNRLFYYPVPFEYTERFIKLKSDKKSINININADFIKGVNKIKDGIQQLIIEFKPESILFDNLSDFGCVEIKTIKGEYPNYKQFLDFEKKYKSREKKLTTVNSKFLAQICTALQENYAETLNIYCDGLESVYINTPSFEMQGGLIILMPYESAAERD
jgi:DNA polymerase III sliding clamp (beta) subunit (PCNA family)